jgi:hypothetical protein
MHLCLSQQNARRLTLQSRGRHPASRAPPLISNVSRLVSECEASVPCLGRCACVQRCMKPVRKSVPVLHPLGSSGAGCPSSGGQRTALLHRDSSLAESRGLLSVLVRAGSGACALIKHALRAKNARFGSAKTLRCSPFEYRRAEGGKGLTKNTNASFQVVVSALFATSWPGYSGGVRRCVPSAG